MSPDLWGLALAGAVGVTAAFIGYWHGVAHTEHKIRPLVERLHAQRQAHMETAIDLARVIYEMRRNGHEMPLSSSERQTFNQITANWED